MKTILVGAAAFACIRGPSGAGENGNPGLDEGGEIHEVKEAARHKDIRTTERYMTAKEERLKALMAKMATRGVA